MSPAISDHPEIPDSEPTSGPVHAAEPESTTAVSNADEQPAPVADPPAPEPQRQPEAEVQPEPTEPPAAQPGTPEAAVPEPEPEPTEPPAEQPSTSETTSPEPTAPAAPRPAPPKPGPRPGPPPTARPAIVAPPVELTASMAFGRVDDDGTVYVRTQDGERAVGSFPGGAPHEALAYFARKYDELVASADLLLARVTKADLSAHDAAESFKHLRRQAKDAAVVGDLAALNETLTQVEEAVAARRAAAKAERARAQADGEATREALVTEAEAIVAVPAERIQWKTSSARMRALLDEWKAAQRSGVRLDRERESALWRRFSAARNSFDKTRRAHFARLETEQGEARHTKERLVQEAEKLATSKDWGPTATAFKSLMDRWRQAGRAARGDDDALWERFKAAQDAFFSAKDEVNAALDREYEANLVVKEQLLTQAEAILPVTDLESATNRLRAIQDKWDTAGKVPRKDIERLEKAMRRIEAAVRDASERRWKSSNPEAAARAQSLAALLEAAVEGLRADLASAQASGDAGKITSAQEALAAREQWLAQARAGVDEFGG